MLFKRSKIKTRPPSWDQGGITAFVGEVEVRIDWDQVIAVYGYNKDCLTVDQIRLIISSKDWNIEFTEDDDQFDRLRSCLTEQLKLPADWYQPLVSCPAFELTWTVVYSKETQKSEEIG